MEAGHKSRLSLLVLATCITLGCAPASNLSLREFRSEYFGEFYAAGTTLVIEFDNIPGVNITTIEAVPADGRIALVARRVSSGGGGRRTHCLDVANLARGSTWTERLAWAEPSGELVRVEPILDDARRTTSGCS